MTRSENPELFQDTPQEGQTSSIGGIWPPVEAKFERIKAFYNLRPITSDRVLALVSQRFARECQRLDGQVFSRVQFRALFGDDFLRSQVANPFLQQYLEAILPLERYADGQRLALVYVGHNSATRQPETTDRSTAWTNYHHMSGVEPKSASAMLAKAMTNGYSLEILDTSVNKDQAVLDLSRLYSRFNMTQADVVAMVGNPDNTICVARDRGTIVSAGIAEQAQIPFPGQPLRIAEITEAATLDGYGNQGLYAALSTRLLVALARQGDLDLVFGECNALSPGVLRVVAYQGRTFSAAVCAEYGFPQRGILSQQVPISGAERHTAYNDLFPASLTPSVLRARYLI